MQVYAHGQYHIHEYNHEYNFHRVLDNHRHTQSIRLIFPMADCVIAGTRFCGFPKGNSPISVEGCAPTGLKYLNKIELHLIVLKNLLQFVRPFVWLLHTVILLFLQVNIL